MKAKITAAIDAVKDATEAAIAARAGWRVRRELLEAAAVLLRAKALAARFEVNQPTKETDHGQKETGIRDGRQNAAGGAG